MENRKVFSKDNINPKESSTSATFVQRTFFNPNKKVLFARISMFSGWEWGTFWCIMMFMMPFDCHFSTKSRANHLLQTCKWPYSQVKKITDQKEGKSRKFFQEEHSPPKKVLTSDPFSKTISLLGKEYYSREYPCFPDENGGTFWWINDVYDAFSSCIFD